MLFNYLARAAIEPASKRKRLVHRLAFAKS